MATVVRNRLSRIGREFADAAGEGRDLPRPLTDQETEWKPRIDEERLSGPGMSR